MIWSVVSKAEMEGYIIPPVFQYYREVFGRENIKLAVVDEDDSLSFVNKDDVVLLRTANKSIIENIKKRKARTTAENFEIYNLVQDKKKLNDYLRNTYSILTPRNYEYANVVDGETYFVKPRFGSESFGVTAQCICKTKKEISEQIKRIENETKQTVIIEEFVSGKDCTVACYYNPVEDVVRTHPILIETDEEEGIQTHIGKFNYNEYCSSMTGEVGERVCKISKEVFGVLGIKHHARIDYRLTSDGKIYMIDVNLLPGLGTAAHFAKCLLLTENISYRDAMKAIIQSATE